MSKFQPRVMSQSPNILDLTLERLHWGTSKTPVAVWWQFRASRPLRMYLGPRPLQGSQSQRNKIWKFESGFWSFEPPKRYFKGETMYNLGVRIDGNQP